MKEVGADAFAREVSCECEGIARLLIEKNNAYGNSALDPLRIFSTADPIEQLKVRIDDKLSRLKRGALRESPPGDGPAGLASEDVIVDLIGYLVLLRLACRKAR